MAKAFLMNQTGVFNPVNSITYTGTYATSTYFTQAGCRTGFNENGELFITIQGGTSASYENVQFAAGTLGSGIALVGQGSFSYASQTVQQYYTAIFSGVTKRVDISINFSAINATLDYVTATVSIAFV